MGSQAIVRVLNQSREYKKRPSEILNISDDYTSFCFDEACMFILSQLDNRDDDGKLIRKPKWNDVNEEITNDNNTQLIGIMSGL